MSWVAIVLLLVSACIHAGWNLLSKHQHPTARFFLAASMAGVVCSFPCLVIFRRTLPAISAEMWALAVVSGGFQALYYLGLSKAYRNGDMSLVYPLARATPVLLVCLLSVALGRGKTISPLCIAGMLILVPGCFILPMKRFDDLRLGNYLNTWVLFALAAAIGTTGYSLIDDHVLREMRSAEDGGLGLKPHTAALIYVAIINIIAALWLWGYVLVRKRLSRSAEEEPRLSLGKAVLAGVFIYLGYTLILVAMGFARNVSYIVAFRQVSIPLGALLGVGVLKEGAHAPKGLGVLMTFSGLVLVAIG